MAATDTDFLLGEQLEDLYLAIETDIFWEDEEFLNDVDVCVTEGEIIAEFKYQTCGKVKGA